MFTTNNPWPSQFFSACMTSRFGGSCGRTRYAVEDAAYLNAIAEHDEVVRRFVGRIMFENE